MRTLSFLSLSIFTLTSLLFFPINASATSAYLLGAKIYIMAPGKLEDYKITTTSQKKYAKPGPSDFTDTYLIHRQLGLFNKIFSGDTLNITYENLKTSKTCTINVDSSQEGYTYTKKTNSYIGNKTTIVGNCHIIDQYCSGGTMDFPYVYPQEIIGIQINP